MPPAFAADPTGDWRVADGVANIRVAQCNGNMWGVVSWEKTPGGRDKNNPDAAKQSRPTLGMPILIDMKKKPGAEAWEGQVYNAKDGQTYSSTIKPSAPISLKIQGCVLGFLCGGETWTRVGPPIPSSCGQQHGQGRAEVWPARPRRKRATAGWPDHGLHRAGSEGGRRTRPGDAVGDICLLPDIARLAH